MGTSDSVDDIKAKLAEAEEFLEGLRSGNLNIGNSSEGRSAPSSSRRSLTPNGLDVATALLARCVNAGGDLKIGFVL